MQDEKLITLDNAIKWDWQGAIGQSAGNRAQFVLYLAMQEGSLSSPLSILPKVSPTNEAVESDAPNHYRKVPLECGALDWHIAAHVNELVNRHDNGSRRLFNAMFPLPLSMKNDASRIPSQVLTNCSLATQKRQNALLSSEIEEDNTLLNEVVTQARQSPLLAAP